MKFGRLVHLALLEPELFKSTVIPWTGSTRTKAFDEAEATAAAKGLLLVQDNQLHKVDLMISSIRTNKFVREILDDKNSLMEHTVHWTNEDYNVDCKSKIDIINPERGVVIDLKTTVDASPEGFGRSVVNYKYDMQAAFYLNGAKTHYKKDFDFIFLAVEKTEPFLFSLQQASADDILYGSKYFNEAMCLYIQSKEMNFWRGYPSEIFLVKRPKWAITFQEVNS